MYGRLLLVLLLFNQTFQCCLAQTKANARVTDFTGLPGDQQIAAAITLACTTRQHTVDLSGISDMGISSNVGIGCPAGTPLEVYFDAASWFVPTRPDVDMFTILPGVLQHGTLTVDVRGVPNYSGKVLQAAGHAYNNSLDNSAAATSWDGLTVYGAGNTTGTALYLESDSPKHIIEFVNIENVAVSGMEFGIHAVISNGGWINSNTITNTRCTNSVYCLVADTLNTEGSFIGNTFTVFGDEYSDNFPPADMNAIWFKGFGDIENNIFPSMKIWDWPKGTTTVKVDASLAHTFGNSLQGMVNLPLVDDPTGSLEISDTLSATSQGVLRYTTGAAIFPFFQATNVGKGYLLGNSYVLAGDGNATVLSAMSNTGTVQLQAANGQKRAIMYPDGFFSVPSGVEIDGRPVMVGTGLNVYLQPQDPSSGSLLLGTSNWAHIVHFDADGKFYADDLIAKHLTITDGCNNCGSSIVKLTAKDAPGAIPIRGHTCTDRSVSVPGLTETAFVSVTAGYHLEPMLHLELGQVSDGVVTYRLCSLSYFTLNKDSVFIVNALQ